MATLWEVFQNDIKLISCSQCDSTAELFELGGEVICRECLEELEYEEQETGLTNEERNK